MRGEEKTASSMKLFCKQVFRKKKQLTTAHEVVVSCTKSGVAARTAREHTGLRHRTRRGRRVPVLVRSGIWAEVCTQAHVSRPTLPGTGQGSCNFGAMFLLRIIKWTLLSVTTGGTQGRVLRVMSR